MSWIPLQPASLPRPVTGDTIVTIKVSKAGRVVAQRVFLTVNPELLPELTWWTYRRPVNVEVGQGEHKGRLRLTDQGQFRIMAATGGRARAKPSSPILQIAGLPGMPADGLERRSVAWEVAGDALIVTLPWSGATGMAKLPNPAPRAVGTPSAALPVPAPPPAASAPPPAAPAPPLRPKNPAPPPETPVPARAPIAMSYAEIERFALANGIGSATHGFDLSKVNALRIKRGEPPCTIRKPGQGGLA